MADLSERIESVAGSPAAASGDMGSASSHSLPDLIAADKHLAAKEALEGTNEQGGSASLWSKLRPAVPRFKRPC